MRRPDDQALLVDIVIATHEARAIASGLSKEQFGGDRLAQLALAKLIEVIGAAASRLSESVRASCSDVPWAAIIGMRDRLVHDYGDIDYEIIWEVARASTVAPESPGPLLPPDESD